MAIWSAEIKELEKLYESFKGQLPELEKELERLIKADDENMILLYSRRCLEVIITDLCECELKRPRKTEPLKGIIDKLLKEEKVPSNIITSMDHLNSLSSYGAHPKDFDPEQVKPVLVNLDIIIKWYLKYKGVDTIVKEEKTRFRRESLEEVKKETRIEEKEKPVRSTKHRFLSGVSITAILVIAGMLVYPKIFKKDTLEVLKSSGERISVAVMPFQNMTNDTTKNFWQEMVQDNLITTLSNSEELKVRQTESISSLLQDKKLTNYASLTPAIASKISQKLDAHVFILGSINQIGTIIRLNAKLVDSKTEEIIKSFQKDGTSENILTVIDTLSAMVRDFLIISKLKQKKQTAFELSTSTKFPEAYRYYSLGKEAFFKYDMPGAQDLLLQAISIDSGFTYAAFLISFAYAHQGMHDEAKKWCMKLYEKRDQMSLLEKTDVNRLYAVFFETPYDAIKYTKQLLEIDDQNPRFYFNLGEYYRILHQYDNAIAAYEKSFEIYDKWDSKPLWMLNYTLLGECYHKTGQYKKENKLYIKGQKDFPGDHRLILRQAILSFAVGDTAMANQYFEKVISMPKETKSQEAGMATILAQSYSEAGILNEAEKYYRQALSVWPKSGWHLNNLAWFLIDTDRDIGAGLELINDGLRTDPDNFGYLHTKGWIFYKQGKYQESLDLLQKSWDLRRGQVQYDHEAFLHLEAAKKAVAVQKNN